MQCVASGQRNFELRLYGFAEQNPHNAISEGYGPTIGIMHEGNDASAAFVFDLIELERPLVDRRILEFVKGHVFDPPISFFFARMA
jgi:hypothetical protein